MRWLVFGAVLLYPPKASHMVGNTKAGEVEVWVMHGESGPLRAVYLSRHKWLG